ncbi:MAG: peptidase S16 [Rhodospirillaceae bacterium]|nr:peptidase S16 [Rhodospirillaceae bacterium]
MTGSGFSTEFYNLPASLPVFPLGGVLLLPYGRLPLNIFEQRYLDMMDDALRSERLIGIIQPTSETESQQKTPSLYKTGCAGRITAFSETEDGRYLITLLGICRFNIEQEIDSTRGYRRIVPNWEPFRSDVEKTDKFDMDKERLMAALRGYFEKKTIDADWEAINRMNNAELITTLSMICPFTATEQQALLVAEKVEDRASTMISLLEMANHEGDGIEDVRH